MKRLLLVAVAAFVSLTLSAQADRSQVRSGNRKFKKNDYKEAEIDYRKALLKDSTSVAASYNLASALYREGNYDEAAKSLESCREAASSGKYAADFHFNEGDVALQKKDYAAAVKAFRESLLLNPSDMAAKENYIYAKMMLKNQQDQQQNQQDQQNQDQNRQEDKNQQQNQDKNQDQQDQQNQDQNNKNQDKDQNQQPQPDNQKLSKQQAQQMLKAVQAQEKNTQDKVKKEKAALLKSKEKEKNW